MPRPPPLARRVAKRSIAGVRVQGEADILVKFAKCCTPVPGDDIVGFISRGHGVVIHTRDCPKALDLDPARRLDVSWDEESKTVRPVAVQVTCTDRAGLLAAISKTFTEHGVNISQAKCRTTEDGRAVNTFQVTVGHLEQLKTVLRSLTSIEGVVLGHPAVIEGRAMASNTRVTWKRRTRKHVNAGKKRKAKESKKSTPSAAELFAGMGPPEGKAGGAGSPRRSSSGFQSRRRTAKPGAKPVG